MRQVSDRLKSRRALQVVALALFIGAALSLTACKSRDQAITEVASAPVQTGTVQATLPVDPTTIAVPEIPVTSTAPPTAAQVAAQAPAPTDNAESLAVATAPDPAKPGTFWPKRVGDFADAFKGPVWYPKYLPAGYKFESLDIVEFDPGSGLVCDIVFTSGEKVLQFTQGSPKNRDYKIVSDGKLDWASGTGYVTHMDPADKSTPVIIVYSKSGNFAELSGDVSTAELKKIAASMVTVK